MIGSACTRANDGPAARPPEAAPSPGASGLRLLYLDGTALNELDLATGDDRRIASLSSPDVHAASGSRWIASLADRQAPEAGEEDFARQPVLRIIDPTSGERTSMGPGFSPLWDATGTRLAWLRPVGPRECSAEACTGEVDVVVADVSSMERRAVLPAGEWGLLSWAGDRLLVSDAADLTKTISVSTTGETIALPVPPSEVWGASPDGSTLLRVAPGGVQLVPLGGGRVVGEGTSVSASRALAEGSWAPDSSALAVISLGRSAGGIPSSRVVVLSIERGQADPVAGSRGAAGQVLWSPDGGSLVFARATGRRGGRLEAVRCPVGPGAACERLLDWRDGVVLLRLQPSP